MPETVGMVLDRLEQKADMALPLKPNANSLEFLQACYRNPAVALPVRIRCAMACLPFEHPKLAVTAVINEQSFAEVLERRLQNMERLANGNGKMIEARPVPQIETRPPKPHTNDRRFRRI